MKYLLFTILIISSISIAAQYTLPLNTQAALSVNTRTLNGKPGNNYWQNKGEYDINVKLDPNSAKITGSEIIKYYNNSPDSLSEIVLSILSDGYQKNAVRDYNWEVKNFNDGVTISRLTINGVKLSEEEMKRNGTNRILNLKEPLLPGTKVEIEVDWSFVFPDIQIRCGDYGDSTFFVAYYYPRVAVYDDIDGWDKNSYTMMTEFYSDFNDYDVHISVPKNFVVWATGELQNPKKVFKKKIYKKFEKAKKSQKVVSIISKEDIQKDAVTRQQEVLTYHYSAKNIPDFAFATSDKFLWDARVVTVDDHTQRTALINTAYRQDAVDYPMIADLTAKVLRNYSTHIPGVPYPYPTMSIFNGNAGMEFPMMCNDASSDKWLSSASLTYHEVAHTYFPFYMGTNERKHAWMDEGWASFLPMFYIDQEDSTKMFDYISSRTNLYYQFAGSDGELPIMTLSNHIKTRSTYRYTSYNKSYFAYYYLYRMLGEQTFKDCLRKYISTWNGKHPTPYDFFNSFNSSSGIDLTWYWESWFFNRSFADLEVTMEGDKTIVIKNKGGLPLPINLLITYADGTTQTITHEADIWNNEDCHFILKETISPSAKVVKIALGDVHILDVNKTDNLWEK